MEEQKKYRSAFVREKTEIRGFTRLVRRQPRDMASVMAEFVKEEKLASGLNERRIYAAWNEVSGAGMYTINCSFRSGVLYVNLNSSVVRSQLYFQTQSLIDAINQFLVNDDLFVKDDPRTCYVRSIVLK